MRITLTLAAASLALLGFGPGAHAGMALTYPPLSLGGVYVTGDAGWTRAQLGRSSYGMTADVGLGYEAGNGARADITYGLSGAFDTSAGEVRVHNLMLNGYYDLPLADAVAAYVGAGAGYGWLDSKTAGADDSGVALAGMAGVDLSLTDAVTGSFGYRFRDTLIDGSDLMEHSLLGGLRYRF